MDTFLHLAFTHGELGVVATIGHAAAHPPSRGVSRSVRRWSTRDALTSTRSLDRGSPPRTSGPASLLRRDIPTSKRAALVAAVLECGS